MNDLLTESEKRTLLQLAREALEHGVRRQLPPRLDQDLLTPTLRSKGASFVTLTKDGQLRGCIGALEPYQSLAEDVREHAADAALQDYRFLPVRPEELPEIEIEVSRLTPARPLDYTSPEDLLEKLTPGLDGVILRNGIRRATFLPQVWEKLPDKAGFLDHLCVKLGEPPDLWWHKHLDVLVYQVEEFHE